MGKRTVLVSGAGIAGSTLAYWLARNGFAVTVVERAGDLRSSGNPVDVRGPAAQVAERMGVLPQLLAARTRATALTFVDARGRRVGRIDMAAIQRAAGAPDIELGRGDLARILLAAGQDEAEFRSGDGIADLRQDGGGVDVEFDRGGRGRYDLVIGADGLHSAVRRLAFGPERDLVQYAGMYVGGVQLAGPAPDPSDVVMFNTPGRAVAVHPGSGRALVAFMFRRPEVADFDYRDAGQHRKLLAEAFADGGWRVPELLAHVEAAPEFYFDAVSQVDLPSWTRGRVALVGDAASCLSLFGDGSTLAIAGAATLAEELAADPDHTAALRRFEARHRELVEPKLRNMGGASQLLVPSTGWGIAVRNLLTRTWPLAAAAVRLNRALRRS